jgi:ornithine decarboxylase
MDTVTTQPAQRNKTLLAMAKHQTPFFLIDLTVIDQAYQRLHVALPEARICYALKANSEQKIIMRLAKLGAHFEIASVNELHLLLALGVSASHVIYSNPVKPWQHIKESFELGVRAFAFDSAGELDKLAQYAPGAEAYLRFRVSDKGSAFPLSKKFGAEAYNIKPLVHMAIERGLKLTGLAFHVGSQSHDPYRWAQAIQASGGIMRELQAEGITLKALNIGGGFPAHYGATEPSLETIGKVIRKAIKQYLPYKVDLIAEPGRALVAESATLVSSVIGRTVRGRKHWLYLDVSAFGGMMETLETSNRFVYPITSSLQVTPETRLASFTLTGPTCDPQDTMFYDVRLPYDISVNDKVYIHSAGAYTLPYASTFNGFPIPKVHYVEAADRRG